ncbi:MAG: COX15/CtaA family protein [Pirellulaceae bacterium]|nr:COX15/CtaA family protein [Pirellulaceae bacterium]
MQSNLQPTEMPYSRAVHGLAVTLTLAVFPLIWVGGLVTTYDAGMAVPDWPNTYGYNMFAYPATTWLFGPFDLLVEHSHRLLGTVAGLLSIGLVAAAWFYDGRNWFKIWAMFVLMAVIAQGALGGFRVLLDQRSFAMIHGCTGPLFFAIATATAVMSSRWWLSRSAGQTQAQFTSRGATRLAAALLVASYCQLIVGAQLRHITAAVDHRVFMAFVHTHLTLAGLVVILAICTSAVTGLDRRTPARVRFPAILIALLVLVQISLGIATWIVNYSLPWQELSEWLAGYTISAKGYWESIIVTAHMATGSLIISLATVTALRAWRSRASVVAKEVNRKWKQQLA